MSVILDPSGAEGYIPIPKNATNSLRATFPEWRATDDYQSDARLFVIIRNPVDRWFSGVAEATFHYDPNRTYDSMLDEARAGRFVWDAHTKPQASFLKWDAELVALEHAAEFIRDRFGRELRWERRRDWEPAVDLVSKIEEFYSDDMRLYEAALGGL